MPISPIILASLSGASSIPDSSLGTGNIQDDIMETLSKKRQRQLLLHWGICIDDVITLAKNNLGKDAAGYRLDYLLLLQQYKNLLD